MQSAIHLPSLIQEFSQYLGAGIEVVQVRDLPSSRGRQLWALNLRLDGQEKDFFLKSFGGSQLGVNEWAGYRFATDLRVDFIPTLQFGSAAEEFLLIDYIHADGNIRSISETPIREQRLVQLAATIGELTAKTYRQEDEYRKIHDRMTPNTGCCRDDESHRFRENISPVAQILHAAAVRIPAEFESEMEQLDQMICNSDECFSFTHGDLSPHNNLLHGDRLYLVDFEHSGFRHFLYDLSSWYFADIGNACLEEMKSTYFQRVKDTIGCSRKEFEIHWQMICKWRCLNQLARYDGNPTSSAKKRRFEKLRHQFEDELARST